MNESIPIAEKDIYTFQTKKDPFDIRKDYTALLSNLNLDPKLLSKEDTALLKTLCTTNIRNIVYYKNRIYKENFWRFAYSIATAILVIGVPIAIFIITNQQANAVKQGEDVLYTTSGLVTALVASVLGFHKLISSWAERRKYRSIFFQAKMDLMNLLFKLEEEHRNQEINDALSEYDKVVSAELRADLKTAIKQSRAIVDVETMKYFELSGSPSFNLSDALISSADAAKSLFGSFKSKQFSSNVEKMETDEKERIAEQKAVKKDIEKNEMTLSVVTMKIQRCINKENKLIDRINDLEDLEESERSASQSADLERSIKDLQIVEDELETLELKYEELEIELKHNKQLFKNE